MILVLTPDDLLIMTEEEKLDFLRRAGEAEAWQECFEPLYTRLMDDDSPRVRSEALAALWEIADETYIEPIMLKAENDPDTAVRARAANVLGIYIFEGAVEMRLDYVRYLEVRKFLLDLASDPDEDLGVRRMAIEALSFDTDEEICDLIEWAYQHSSPQVRMSAMLAMGRSGSARWHDHILEGLESKDTKMKLEAIKSAGEAHLAEATPVLRSLTRDPEKEVRLEAIWALSHAGGPGALETLEMCAQSPDEDMRRVAVSAIEEFRFESSIDRGEDMDEDEDDGYDN